MNLLSVIIPNLHSPVIGQTLAALQAQDYTGAFEVIVVGQDRYGLVKESGNVRAIFTAQPTPPARARNLGVRAAKGDLLLFLDADCIPCPEWLRLHAAHYSDSFVDVVGGGVTFLAENYWTLADNLGSFYEFLADLPKGVRQQLPSLNLSVRRTVLEITGLFDERYPYPAGEDADLTTRLRKGGFLLHFDPAASVMHLPQRSTPESLFRHAYNFGRYSVKVDRRYASFLETPYILRYWYLAILMAPIMAAGTVGRMLRLKRVRQNLHTLPAIYLAKLIWCFGAANSLQSGGVFGAEPAAVPSLEKLG